MGLLALLAGVWVTQIYCITKKPPGIDDDSPKLNAWSCGNSLKVALLRLSPHPTPPRLSAVFELSWGGSRDPGNLLGFVGLCLFKFPCIQCRMLPSGGGSHAITYFLKVLSTVFYYLLAWFFFFFYLNSSDLMCRVNIRWISFHHVCYHIRQVHPYRRVCGLPCWVSWIF